MIVLALYSSLPPSYHTALLKGPQCPCSIGGLGAPFPLFVYFILRYHKVSLSCQGYLELALRTRMSAAENNASYFPIISSWLILLYSLWRLQSFCYICSIDCRSIVIQAFNYCNRYGINEDLIWLSVCWNGPQGNGNLHKNLLLWERKVPARAELGNLSPRKRCHRVLTTCQTTVQPETEAQTMLGQWWAGANPDLDCLDVHILNPQFRLYITSGSQGWTWQWSWWSVAESFCPSSQCGHIQ